MPITALDCAQGISGAQLVSKVNETISQVNDNTENKLDKEPNTWTTATITSPAFVQATNEVRYRLFQDKVELIGKLERNATAFNLTTTTLFNVAANFRPATEKKVVCLAFKNDAQAPFNRIVPAMVIIQPNGDVRISSNEALSTLADYIHFDGLSYHLD